LIGVLLDEHVSGPVIGSALADDGLNVRAADTDASLKETEDGDLFAIASAERRVLITNDAKDFAPMIRELADRGQDHSGVIFIPHNIRSRDFGSVISQLRRLLIGSTPDDWLNRVEWTHRHSM
jgi:predicted nuclease of predicted toxin-antitoxin system